MADSQNYEAPPKDADSSDETDSRSEDILETAKKRYKLAEEAWSDIYKAAKDDIKFLSGDQWDAQMKNARTAENRPCFTVNGLAQPLKQLVNDQKQNKPSIKLSPADDFADEETAEVFQGVIRNIENNSNAGAAYTHALLCSAGGSFGFFEIRTDYASDLSFEIEPKICRIPDPSSVLLDPFFKEPDGSDASWGFKVCEYSKDDYQDEFGESKLGVEKEWKDFEGSAPGWITDQSVRVAEYYCKEYQPIDLVQLSDGNVYDAKDLSEQNWPADQMGQPLQLKNKRKAKKCIVKHYKINGIEILEETEFPAPFIPLIPVLGEELYIDGKRVLKSLIRDAKTSQQLLNLWISSEAEAIALTPKAPFVADERAIPKEYEHMWRSANIKTHAFLKYRGVDERGNPIPAPQRNFAEPAVQAITNARMQAADDIKKQTGYHDASLGAQANETSGVAIQRRTAQSQTSSYHFIDNLNRSIRHAGRILVDLIPQVYDTERTVRIIGDEGDEKVVTINKVLEDGKKIDFSVGKYDVVVETGPSFATRRQEASQYMIQFIQAYPQAAPLLGDLIAKNQDWPGHGEIQERLKKQAIKMGLIEDDSQDKQPPIPPQVQAQMQQMNQMIEQLTQKLHESNDTIKTKHLELESRERIELAKLKVAAEMKLADIGSKEGLALLGHEVDQIKTRLNSYLDFNEPLDGDSDMPQPGQQPPQQQPNLNQNFNGPQSMPDQQAPMPNQQQPPGGLPPGPIMGGQ